MFSGLSCLLLCACPSHARLGVRHKGQTQIAIEVGEMYLVRDLGSSDFFCFMTLMISPWHDGVMDILTLQYYWKNYHLIGSIIPIHPGILSGQSEPGLFLEA